MTTHYRLTLECKIHYIVKIRRLVTFYDIAMVTIYVKVTIFGTLALYDSMTYIGIPYALLITMISYINRIILTQASKLKYTVADHAPGTEKGLFNQASLVIWSGASDDTIFDDCRVNWAFRALHDSLHLKTGLGFSIAEEIYLGRLQANQYSGILADLVYSEVAEQAEYYRINGVFVPNQKTFAIDSLKSKGLLK